VTPHPDPETPPPAGGEALDQVTKLLEEIAHDNMALTARLGALERGQRELGADVVREIGALRRELTGALAYRALKDLGTELIGPLTAMDAMIDRADFADVDAVAGHVRSLALTLRGVLGRMGVEKVTVAVGERYDPNRHRCVAVHSAATSPLPQAPPHTIVRVIEDGYALERRPLIPPTVEIQGGPAAQPDAE
jgi:molecular chaperone GrpE (heat shock protein)